MIIIEVLLFGGLFLILTSVFDGFGESGNIRVFMLVESGNM